MKPATIHFQTRNNEAWQEGFTLRFVGGADFDFADYAPLRMQVKVAADSPLFELDLTEGDGIAVAVDGGLDIDVPLADVFDLAGTYTHDIVGTLAGDLVVIAIGTVTFVQGNTYTWP